MTECTHSKSAKAKRCRSCAAKFMATDPEIQRRRREGIKRFHEKPGVKIEYRERMRRCMEKVKADPVLMEKRREQGRWSLPIIQGMCRECLPLADRTGECVMAYTDHQDVTDGAVFDEVAAYLEAGRDITEAKAMAGMTVQEANHAARHIAGNRPIVAWVDHVGRKDAALAFRAEAVRLGEAP